MPRFFQGYEWRFIFTDIPSPSGAIGGTTTTWAQGLQRDRQVTLNLNDSSQVDMSLWPDDLRVNQIFTDGYPLVAQSKRLVYGLRREGPNSPNRPGGYDQALPWVPRAAGILMIVEDQADPDVPLTHITAYDPWKLLAARPCVAPGDVLPGPYGLKSWAAFGFRGDQVIAGALASTIFSAAGGHAFVDAGPSYGGTNFWGGTIEETDDCLLDIQQGNTVADVWTSVCDTGNCDIVLTPIYDPVNRPGYTHDLSIYNLAGSDLPYVPFGYDKLNRAASTIDRLHDATPGNFNDVVQYFVGQGGFPVPLQQNLAAIGDFGYYWSQQFFPGQTIPDGRVVLQLAQQAIRLSKQGKRTVTLNPTPERSSVPLTEYTTGDRVPVYATNRIRVAITDNFATDPVQAFRVETIPISITDDGIETVQALLLSPDWRQPIDSGGGGGDGCVVADTAVGTASGSVLSYSTAAVRRQTTYWLGRP